MELTADLTDSAVLQELGMRLERRRIDARLTQAELATQAGISKRTLERIEAGSSTDFVMIIRVLRTLKLFIGLQNLVPDLPQSPMALLKVKGRERKRVGRPRNLGVADGTPTSLHPWHWEE